MPDYSLEDVAQGMTALRNSLNDDVLPILQATMRQEKGGYFIIPREVFAYVDFLGALYCGYDGSVDRAGRRRIASWWKAERFLEEVFGGVDPMYQGHGRLAYEMYRHGTIHVFRPHKLARPDGATIEWLAYKGERSNVPVRYATQHFSVSHLEPYLLDAGDNRSVLPLSINVLYQDLFGRYRRLRTGGKAAI